MSKESLNTSKRCSVCKSPVVNDAVFCKICNSPYHPSCAVSVEKLDNGAYTKCCKPRSPTTESQTDSSTSVATSVMTNDSVEQIVRKTIDELQKGLNFSSLSTSMKELSLKFYKATSKMEEAVTTVNEHTMLFTMLSVSLLQTKLLINQIIQYDSLMTLNV